MAATTLAKGMNAGLRKAMETTQGPRHGRGRRQARWCLPGHRRLQKDFGEDRVIDTPAGRVRHHRHRDRPGLPGYRPVCEIQFDGFVYPAFDQIVSQLAKMRPRSLGYIALPIVVRIPVGGGIGAVEHHSESNEAYFAHTAGLRVVACSNPVDAHWMIQQAIATDDPVIFYEPKRRYWEKADLDESASLADAMPLHAARVVREGTDVTLAAYGPMVRTCLEAAIAADAEGRSLEVLDLRTLSPLDTATLTASVRKTGRLVVVHEAPVFVGMGAEIAARVTEQCFYSLEAPVLRVGGLRHPLPPEQARGGVPPRPRPRPRRRRPLARLLGDRPVPEAQALQAPRRRRGPHRGRDRLVEGQARRHRQGQRRRRRDRDAKSLVELPSPYAGVVAELLVDEGRTVDVGTPIIAVDTAPSASGGEPDGGRCQRRPTTAVAAGVPAAPRRPPHRKARRGPLIADRPPAAVRPPRRLRAHGEPRRSAAPARSRHAERTAAGR
jgi:pyruvate dehydrogenase E1 component beta subunit